MLFCYFTFQYFDFAKVFTIQTYVFFIINAIYKVKRPSISFLEVFTFFIWESALENMLFWQLPYVQCFLALLVMSR